MFAQEAVTVLRAALSQGQEEGAHDDRLTEVVSVAIEEFEDSGALERTVGHHVTRIYSKGLVDAWHACDAAGKRWVVADDPGCDHRGSLAYLGSDGVNEFYQCGRCEAIVVALPV